MTAKKEWIQKVKESGIVAVIRNVPEDKMKPLAESLLAGGVQFLEVTLDQTYAYDSIRMLTSEFKDQAYVGAGTVLEAEQVKRAVQAGAEYIISPILNKEVIDATLNAGKISIPGVYTPTEMWTAMKWGADIVKVFPASGLGVKYIKDVKGPLPQVPIIPTGGVSLDNIGTFIQAGVVAVGIGGNLVNVAAIRAGEFKKITETAKQYVQAIKEARSAMA